MADTKIDIITKLINYFKSPRYLFAISLISGVLLFSPKYIINSLGIQLFISKYRVWIGIAFLISFGFWITDISVILLKKRKLKSKVKFKISEREVRLKNLTYEEKIILSFYIDYQTRTQRLPYSNGVVNELIYYKILYRSSNIINMDFKISYNIQPWAWDYLNKHPELLQDNPNYPVGGYL